MFSIYAKIAAALALLAALAGIYWKIHHDGVVSGRAEIQAKWDASENARKVAEDKAIADRLKQNELRTAQVEADKQKLKKGYADELAKIRAAGIATGSLRIAASVCGGSSTIGKTESTSGSAADIAATIALPDAITANLFSLMQEADTVTAGCRVLQDFVKSQDMAP